MKTCDNPVARHYELGRRPHIRGTPTIVLDDGRTIGGDVPAERLRAILDRDADAEGTDAR